MRFPFKRLFAAGAVIFLGCGLIPLAAAAPPPKINDNLDQNDVQPPGWSGIFFNVLIAFCARLFIMR